MNWNNLIGFLFEALKSLNRLNYIKTIYIHKYIYLYAYLYTYKQTRTYTYIILYFIDEGWDYQPHDKPWPNRRYTDLAFRNGQFLIIMYNNSTRENSTKKKGKKTIRRSKDFPSTVVCITLDIEFLIIVGRNRDLSVGHFEISRNMCYYLCL